VSPKPRRAELLAALNGIPPFPPIAIKALQLVSNDKTRLRELSRLISTDASLSSEVLRIANSALYGHRVEVESVFRATVSLGLERIKSVVVTSALRHYIGRSLDIPWIRMCWRHSLACAVIAEELARGSSLGEDVAYTAGIIHDIGRFALAVAFPDRCGRLLAETDNACCDVLERERECFGMDHCEAGKALMLRWDIPKNLVAVASHHHDPPADDDSEMLAIIRHACKVADAAGFAVMSWAQPHAYEKLLADLPVKSKIPRDPEELAFRISNKIASLENVDVKPPTEEPA
jgi:putative nucleotidyltransferase with HDIG domain